MWRVVVSLASLLAVAAVPLGEEVDPDKLAPQFVDFKVFSLTSDVLAGELKFEKAYLEFTEHMNGYAAFLAHSCDEFLTLLNAQSDDQNPAQLNAEQRILQREAEDASPSASFAPQPSGASPSATPSPSGLPVWPPPIPEALIPIGWREKMKSVQVPSMVDNALQSDVEPFLEFVRYKDAIVYNTKFSVNVPTIANVVVLYGGMFMPDPKFEAEVRSGKVKSTDKPKTVFVPLSSPVILQFRKDPENSLYQSPLAAKFEGGVENNVLNGVLTFAGAFYENLVPGYTVLFGTGPHAYQRLGTEFSVIRGMQPVGRHIDGRYEVRFTNVDLSPQANHLLVFGGHPHNCNKPAAVNLFPAPSPSPINNTIVVPDNSTVRHVRLVTEGPKNGNLTGTLTWDNAPNESDFLGYVLQWSASQLADAQVPLYGGNPLTDFNIMIFWKSPAVPNYTAELRDLVIPRGAKFLRISGFSHYESQEDPAHAAKPFGTPAFVALAGGQGSN